MTSKDRIDANREFAVAKAVRPMADAPLNGMPIIARHRKGDIAHIRWCTGDELEAGERPYWGRWETDIEFKPIGWVPTVLTITDILEVYG